MTWFEHTFGFAETQFNIMKYIGLSSDNTIMYNSKLNIQHKLGQFTIKSLKELRTELKNKDSNEVSGTLQFSKLYGDVSKLHSIKQNALFQVASQFNCLEMMSPDESRMDGITKYMYDKTQGPACALATPYATLYRNYFTDINTLDKVEEILNEPFWVIQNGYTIFNKTLLPKLNALLCSSDMYDVIEENIQYGIVQGTDVAYCTNTVDQIFCSAIPVSYNRGVLDLSGLSSLVLEAAYEATFILGILTNKTVYITQLGGGAFGNRQAWIRTAIANALEKFKNYKLEVVEVVYTT